MKKSERLAILARFILEHEVERQEDLVTLFSDAGLEVTQATISRDMKDLGLVKVLNDSGRYRYQLPGENLASTSFFSGHLESLTEKDDMICLQVTPGSAMAIKQRLIENYEQDIFAIIADDDTVLIVAMDSRTAKKLKKELESYAARSFD